MSHHTRSVTRSNTFSRIVVSTPTALTAGVALTQPLAAAEIVVNGGFEEPVVAYEAWAKAGQPITARTPRPKPARKRVKRNATTAP